MAQYIVGELFNANANAKDEVTGQPLPPKLSIYSEVVYNSLEEALDDYTRRLGASYSRELFIAKRLAVRTVLIDYDEAGELQQELPHLEEILNGR